MTNTKIEWATHTWNPVTGCTPISEGCQNCYARRMANRLRGRCGYPADDPFRVTLHPERLGEPLRWRKPSRVFVCSMGDLFHPDVQPIWLSMIFNVIRECPQHTFMVLTKRPEIALEHLGNAMLQPYFGLPNLWIGVTAENQQRADERIPILLQIPAAVRFISVEPMLGLVDLTGIRFDRNTIMNVLEGCGINRLSPCQSIPNAFCKKIDWVICGGETGPGARPMHPDWVRNLRNQCQEAGVPFFFKQWGEWFPRDQWEWNPELVLPDDEYAFRDGSGTHVFESIDGLCPVHRVGKKKADRILDGETWDEMPEI